MSAAGPEIDAVRALSEQLRGDNRPYAGHALRGH